MGTDCNIRSVQGKIYWSDDATSVEVELAAIGSSG